MQTDWNEIRKFIERDSKLLRDNIAVLTPAAIAASVAARYYRDSNKNILLILPERNEAIEVSEALKGLIPDKAVLLEAWDALPFEPASLLPNLSASRVEFFCRLSGVELAEFSTERTKIFIAYSRSITRLTLPVDEWKGISHLISYADEISPSSIRTLLIDAGYTLVNQVSQFGEYSVRGGILDYYSPGNPWPCRILWDGDLIENIRFFDPASQRTIGSVEKVNLLPPRELKLPKNITADKTRRVKSAGCGLNANADTSADSNMLEVGRRELGDVESSIQKILSSIKPSLRRDRFVESIRAGSLPEGIEILQPFFSDMSSIFELGECELILVDPLRIKDNVAEIYQEALKESEISDLGYDASLLWLSEIPDKLHYETILSFPLETSDVVSIEPLPPSRVDSRILRTDISRLITLNDKIIILTSFRNRVKELLKEEKINYDEIDIIESHLLRGIRLPDSGISIIGNEDLFGQSYKKIRKGLRKKSSLDWKTLKPGEYVVHINHGVGIFRGIERISSLGEERDVILIEYADDDKLYIPPYETGLLERYTVLEGQTPRLDKLGTGTWQRLREKAELKAVEIARELLDMYALRHSAQGYKYSESIEENSFASAFGYEETEDQEEAIKTVFDDLEKSIKSEPMDRLICGDVGFGKTEVALRASFKVVRNGKQVAVLCPTTVLTLQHFETFDSRMKPFGIKTAALSRFQSTKESTDILQDLESGKIDIIIGTHKLLGDSVRFKDLGLIVIDEEQRFGVRHKEKLKKIRRKVDVLTLTATPIPRTLHLALSGARSLSVIETPPPGRSPVQTIVEPFNEEHIRRAIKREIERGGQIFYVHNRIETIERAAGFIKRNFPKISIAVAHGSTDEKILSKTIIDFMSGKISILVSTTIIENGLDIPNANTLIVDQAERFGLAQLYQLRGRIGRSNRKAYAYFFHSQDMTEDARARLAAIAEHTALGSGYSIARRDMEIRGAGEILGVLQHGEMESVGYDMYCRLLKDAIEELKGVKKEKKKPVVVDLILPSFVPPDWAGGEEIVGAIHREIAEAESVSEVDSLRESFIDRFGSLPLPVENLLRIAELRAYAKLCNVESIYESEKGLRIRWYKPPIDMERWFYSIRGTITARFEGEILVIENIPKGIKKIEFIKRLIRR